MSQGSAATQASAFQGKAFLLLLSLLLLFTIPCASSLAYSTFSKINETRWLWVKTLYPCAKHVLQNGVIGYAPWPYFLRNPLRYLTLRDPGSAPCTGSRPGWKYAFGRLAGGKIWFKHKLYKGRIITSCLNMFKPMAPPSRLDVDLAEATGNLSGCGWCVPELAVG